MGFIYKISSPNTEKIYIGQTRLKINQRWSKHKSSYKKYLKDKKGTCRELYGSFDTYSIESFGIYIIEECDDDDLNEKEIYYIDKFDTMVPNGLNIQQGGKSCNKTDRMKKIISQKTSEAITQKNIDNFRKNDLSKGLPKHIIYLKIKGRDAFAVNNHPLCKRKSFTVINCDIDQARTNAIMFLNGLEKSGEKINIKHKTDELPKGMRKIKSGYIIEKQKNKIIYRKTFYCSPDPPDNFEERLMICKTNAISYLQNLNQQLCNM